MASVVINDLESRAAAAGGDVCVAYVYFRYSDAANLTVRDVFDDSFLEVGTYDVADRPMKYLEGLADDACTEAEPCDGFIAQGGTVDVLSLAPFQATFSLSALTEATTATDGPPGPAIGGTVTGCLNTAN